MPSEHLSSVVWDMRIPWRLVCCFTAPDSSLSTSCRKHLHCTRRLLNARSMFKSLETCGSSWSWNHWKDFAVSSLSWLELTFVRLLLLPECWHLSTASYPLHSTEQVQHSTTANLTFWNKVDFRQRTGYFGWKRTHFQVRHSSHVLGFWNDGWNDRCRLPGPVPLAAEEN